MSPRRISVEPAERCATCGELLVAGGCTTCGTPRAVELKWATGDYKLTGLAPTLIVDGPERLSVNSPSATTNARFNQDRAVVIDGSGVEGGTKAEPWVIDTLCNKLREFGAIVAIEKGQNDRGEDGLIVVDGERIVVQVTTPGMDGFMKDARVRHASRTIPGETHVAWIRQAIERKASKIPPRDRPRVLLAVDTRHAGIVAPDAVGARTFQSMASPVPNTASVMFGSSGQRFAIAFALLPQRAAARATRSDRRRQIRAASAAMLRADGFGC